MLMSQAARSEGVIGCPYLGASPPLAGLNPSERAMAKAILSCINMAHLPFAIDAPACNGVAVLHGKRGNIRSAPRWTTLGNECLSRGLNVTSLVGCPALQ